MRDFTLQAYMRLIDKLRYSGLSIYGVADWLIKKPKMGALIRHDVDRKPKNALEMAKAEAATGVFTTYYFRVIGSAYNPKIIREIANLGHEVGYHYEDLALAKGDMKLAKQLFERHLAELRTIVPIITVAMHGSPLSPYTNSDIWKFISHANYNLIGDALLTVDYSKFYYFSDTGRAWNSTVTNLRDKVASSMFVRPNIRGTKELIDFISSERINRIAISLHPERWDKSIAGWLTQLIKDMLINIAKYLLTKINKIKK
jgi:hypothetical protein